MVLLIYLVDGTTSRIGAGVSDDEYCNAILAAAVQVRRSAVPQPTTDTNRNAAVIQPTNGMGSSRSNAPALKARTPRKQKIAFIWIANSIAAGCFARQPRKLGQGNASSAAPRSSVSTGSTDVAPGYHCSQYPVSTLCSSTAIYGFEGRSMVKLFLRVPATC